MTATVEFELEGLIENFDVHDERLKDHFYETLEAMRRRGPVHRSEAHGGYWVVVGHREVTQVARDWRHFSSAGGVVLAGTKPQKYVPVEYDPPQHQSFRRLLNPHFSKAAAATFEPQLAVFADKLIDAFIANGSADLTEAYAKPLAAHFFFDLFFGLSLGGHFDPATKRYVLIMEDVTRRGAIFPSNLEAVGVANVRRILDVVAALHSRYWESDRFSGDLSWMETHLKGGVEDHMQSVIPEQGISSQLELHKFKREILERLETTERELFGAMCANKKHQATLPQTLLHGDLHIGNTYRMPDGSVGLHDWQLCVRGFALHDVTYIINTALSIEERRSSERSLLDYYREKLIEFGVVNPPDRDMLWLEHRRASLWTLYIGWLTCPPESYGWETMAVALLRVSTAVEDHGTLALVRETAPA